MLDLLAFAGLDWLYDAVEKRFGVAAAWLVTLFVGLSVAVFALWILIRFVLH
jgi:hypothetical protein